MRRIIAPLVLGLGLVLVGCDSSSQRAGDAGAPDYSAGSEDAQRSTAQDSDIEEPRDSEPRDSESARQVISAGDMRVITDNPAEAANGVVEHGESRGGYVESREEWVDHDGEAAVDIALRVPADEFEKLMTDVDGSGEVVQRSQSAEDVTGAVRDLDSRIGALEVSTERLEDIMGEADTSADLLEAEAALSERQGELEELVAQREDLDDQVSMSTLRVELRSTDRADDSGGIADWFLDVWNALLNSAGGLVIVLAALLPWVVVIGIPAYLITRWLIRRSGRRSRSRRAPGSEDLQDGAGVTATNAPDSYETASGGVDGRGSVSDGGDDPTGVGPRS